MTDLDIEKQADEEMLKMYAEDASSEDLLDDLTELPDIDLISVNTEGTTEDKSSTEISEDLLNELELGADELDTSEDDEKLPELEELVAEEGADADLAADAEVSLEDIQSLNEDLDELIETQEETSEIEEIAEEAELDDLPEEAMEEAMMPEEAAELDGLPEEDTATLAVEEDVELDELQEDSEPTGIEAEESLEETPQVASQDDDSSDFINPNQVVDQMQAAIDLQTDTEEMASSIKETAKDVTKLAAATALQAQEAAENAQKNIQDTFIAAERAFETIKKAGYLLDSSSLDNLSDSELATKLENITQKNTELKQANEEIKQRLAAMKR